MRIVALMIAGLLSSSAISAQTITTLPLPYKSLCPLDSVDIVFEANGSFGDNNIFNVQLSNYTGTFDEFQTVGSTKSTSSDTIRIGIPDDLRESGEYRLRVISTSPYVVGSDNGEGFFIPDRGAYHVGSTPYNGVVMDTFQLMVLRAHQPFVASFSYGWDFGEGAMPKVGYGNPPPKVVYKTPGKKNVRVSVSFGTGCTKTMSLYLYVADCFPKIPNNARIVDPDSTYGPRSGHTWVRSGARYRGESDETIYAEAGSVIEIGGDARVIYLKPGAEFHDGDASFVVYGEGASPGSGYNVVQFKPLDFDYSEAPTPEQYASVSNDLAEFTIETIGDRIEIRAADRYIRDVKIYDILGRQIYEQQTRDAVSIAGWARGKYVVRVNFGGTVMSRLISIGR